MKVQSWLFICSYFSLSAIVVQKLLKTHQQRLAVVLRDDFLHHHEHTHSSLFLLNPTYPPSCCWKHSEQQMWINTPHRTVRNNYIILVNLPVVLTGQIDPVCFDCSFFHPFFPSFLLSLLPPPPFPSLQSCWADSAAGYHQLSQLKLCPHLYISLNHMQYLYTSTDTTSSLV